MIVVQYVSMSEPTTHDSTEVGVRADSLRAAGVHTIIGSWVNASGVTLGKSVPTSRLTSFVRSGLGSAPVWNVFTIDGGIAFTEHISPVGDYRLRADVAALRAIGGGHAWAPMSLFNQDGTPSGSCSRGALARVDGSLAAAGYSTLVGHELEFVLVAPDGSELNDTAWVPYGVTGLLDRSAFLDDLVETTDAAGVQLEQLHAEYGKNQFEFSLPPKPAVAAADTVVLAKVLVGQVARRHGLGVSFSPSPFPGSVGSGAHQHFSFTHEGASVFAGGGGPYGMTDAGMSGIAGIIDGLADIQGILTGSILSGSRLSPGSWSGAYACWGVENREAAVRYLIGGDSNPLGSNIEVKIVDPSANVYLATAAILGLALRGIENHLQLPEEVASDPGRLTPEQFTKAKIKILSADPGQIIDVLDGSTITRGILGDDIVDATVAVRRYEQTTYADRDPQELAERFRLAWSI